MKFFFGLFIFTISKGLDLSTLYSCQREDCYMVVNSKDASGCFSDS